MKWGLGITPQCTIQTNWWNVKQLRTGLSFRTLLPFFRISWGVGVLNSAIFNSFHNRIEYGTTLEDLRNFGEGGGSNLPKHPSVRHCSESLKVKLCLLSSFSITWDSFTNVSYVIDCRLRLFSINRLEILVVTSLNRFSYKTRSTKESTKKREKQKWNITLHSYRQNKQFTEIEVEC